MFLRMVGEYGALSITSVHAGHGLILQHAEKQHIATAVIGQRCWVTIHMSKFRLSKLQEQYILSSKMGEKMLSLGYTIPYFKTL